MCRRRCSRVEFEEESDVRVFRDVNEMSLRAAAAAVAILNDAVQTRGRCSIALSGGTTPRTLYRLLASQFRDQVPWEHVHVFWADERYVPAADPRSNYRMAKELLLDHVPCPAANIHPMPTGLPSAELAASDYEGTLRTHFRRTGWPAFDLVLLGLGDDGHTASLFPGSPALTENSRWVVAVEAPADPPSRLTLTLPVITQAAAVFFLVAGAAKARALHQVLEGVSEWTVYPAAGLLTERTNVTWWVDAEAAARLGHTVGAT
jgi:6-phosphogluconolactonase